ncbi:MAG: carbohydrate porin [Alphaproteobacteria bacterium]|nr:carbohydrate porin [Alphaproteobacteria bacterium]MBV9693737.1 carbohydrate porin [Alphaproteobacteria bacterium]
MGKTVQRLIFCFALASPFAARADDAWSLHAQATFVDQYHPAFHSPYLGTNSLSPESVGEETFDLTAFLGVRLWRGGELYADPEVDQGFGLSDTLGLAGFASGEAYKVGKSDPYFRLQRLFFRQSFDLGGDSTTLEDGQNQIAGTRTANSLVITAGKMSVTDIFDANSYAHDPKSDFLNWSLIDSGAFDYAADAWGYSYGTAAEWTQDRWTLRLGLFDLSRVPNSTELETGFGQFELVSEGEARLRLFGRAGKIRLLGFLNRGRMGGYRGAVALGQATGTTPDTALVRQYASRGGGALNLEQEIADDLGAFLRASLNDGSKEAYEFTEIDRSLAAGLSLKGTRWGRNDDTFGLAAVVNGLSRSARSYFAAGGLGILIGDGRLPHYGTEDILEAYYNAAVTGWLNASADYQFVANPAYNRDRGPVSILALRLHAQI